MSVTILVESIVNPTESEEKVERALRNLFPSAKIEPATPDNPPRLRIRGEGVEFLTTLRNLIKQDRIRSAAKAVLLSRTEDHRIYASLNKQAAFAGRVSFEPEGRSPLGPISIAIDAPNPIEIIDYLTHRVEARRRWHPTAARQ